MTNAAAVIGLTYRGQDIQTADLGIFLEILRGINEIAVYRGADIIVPSRDGRIYTKRKLDRIPIELSGYIMGMGTVGTIAAAPETSGGLNTTLTADAAAGATSIVVASAGTIDTGDFLRIGAPGKTEIKAVGTYVSGLTIPLTAPLIRGYASGVQVREVDSSGTEVFRTNAQTVRALFDPRLAPGDLVCSLEDSSTLTLSARSLNIISQLIAPTLTQVSIELEAGFAEWSAPCVPHVLVCSYVAATGYVDSSLDVLGGKIAASSYGYIAAGSPYASTATIVTGASTAGTQPLILYGTPNSGGWGINSGVGGAGPTNHVRWVWDLLAAGSPRICTVGVIMPGSSWGATSLSITASNDGVTWTTVVTNAALLAAGTAVQIVSVANANYRYWALDYAEATAVGYYPGIDLSGVLFWAAV